MVAQKIQIGKKSRRRFQVGDGAWVEVAFDSEKNGNNGERRFGMERRTFSYALHLPERRSGKDRRNGFDRGGGR